MCMKCALRLHVQRIFSHDISEKKKHECRDRKRGGGYSNNVKTENFRRCLLRRLTKLVLSNYSNLLKK